MGADVLKLLVAPFLRAPAPGAGAHRVHHAAAATPLAASMVLEPLGGFERLGARVSVGDVATAPGAEREAVRHHPAAVVALRAGLFDGVAPLEPAAAVREIGRASCRERGEGGGVGVSSRRRHTRWPRDWSSDVCSSDLRRWYLNPLGALSGSGLESRSAMSRPHQGQNEKLSDTTQPQ